MKSFEVIDSVTGFHAVHELGPDEAQEKMTCHENSSEIWLELEGKRHGLCKTWHREIETFSTSYYWMGKLHGPSEYKTVDGRSLSSCFFIDDRKWGPAFFWYESGILAKELHYKNDHLHGIQKYFSPEGSLRTEMNYNEGKAEGFLRQFHEKGQLIREVFFKNGLKEGCEKFCYPSGNPQIERYFCRGEPCHKSITWYESGQVAEEIEYLEPAWKFNIRKFSSSGSLLLEGVSSPDGSYEEKQYDVFSKIIGHRICERDVLGKVLKERLL